MDSTSSDIEIDYDKIMEEQALKLMAMKGKGSLKKKNFFGSYSQQQQQPISATNPNSYDDDEETVPFTPNPSQDNKEATNPQDSVRLSMRLKKKVVQSSSFGEQTFPMLVSLLADDGKAASRAPIDLVCVIDVSGSMQGEKIEPVKQTFTYLLKYLGDADRLSIVLFSTSAMRLIPLIRTTEINKERILTAVKSIQATGGTDINQGMIHAFKVLEKRRFVNPVSSIFLLSDGLDNGAQKKVSLTLSECPTLGDVTIHTFGFGRDHDSQLMSDIADLRDGNFYFVKELSAVDKAFVDCLGGLLSSVAQSVEIKIQPEQSETLQGVEIVKAYGDSSMWKQQDQTYTTTMLSLISGRQKDFVLELKIPTTTEEFEDNEKVIKIASAEVVLVGLDNKQITKKAELYITLLNEAEEMKEEYQEDDKRVTAHFYRVKGAFLMAEANKLADNKHFEEAKKILQNFKEELENSTFKGATFVKNLVTDISGAIAYVDPQVYGTIGQHSLRSNFRAHFKQKTTFDSADYFQNEVQTNMLGQLEAMKNA